MESSKEAFIHNTIVSVGIYNYFSASGEDSLKISDLAKRISKFTLDEKISSLLAIDESMADAMINYAKQQNDQIDSRELSISKWQQTVWHKIIKSQVDELRELRKELE